MKKISDLDVGIRPYDYFAKVMGGKWKPYIIRGIQQNGYVRFAHLQRILGVSGKVLQQQLREMEEDGIIERKVYSSVPPRVDYVFTGAGERLVPIYDRIFDWAIGHMEEQGLPIAPYSQYFHNSTHNLGNGLMIRCAILDDLDQISEMERLAFPKEDRSTRKQLEQRLRVFPNHFLLLYHNDTLAAYLDGMITDRDHFSEFMYRNTNMHDEMGEWQMLLDLATHPDFRNRGYAGLLMRHYLEENIAHRRSGTVLVCEEELTSFFEQFGFEREEAFSFSDKKGEYFHMRALSRRCQAP